jgi:hypothetical protein
MTRRSPRLELIWQVVYADWCAASEFGSWSEATDFCRERYAAGRSVDGMNVQLRTRRFCWVLKWPRPKGWW